MQVGRVVNLVSLKLALVDSLKEILDLIISKHSCVKLIDDPLDSFLAAQLLIHGGWHRVL